MARRSEYRDLLAQYVGPVDVVIDGDIFAFRAMAAHQRAARWSPDIWSAWGDVASAAQQFDRQVAAALESVELDPDTTRVLVAKGDAENFRKTVDPTYKANRADKPKPVGLVGLWEHIATTYTVVSLPGVEADDVVGILGTATDAWMMSSDKDFLGIPGRHLRLTFEPDVGVTAVKTVVSRKDANRHFAAQCIAGDPTDGFSGVPGMGMQSAEKLIAGRRPLVLRSKTLKSGPRKGDTVDEWIVDEETPEASSFWPIVVSAFHSKGLSDADALRTARLAYILRAEDYDFTTMRPKLWTPPTPNR